MNPFPYPEDYIQGWVDADKYLKITALPVPLPVLLSLLPPGTPWTLSWTPKGAYAIELRRKVFNASSAEFCVLQAVMYFSQDMVWLHDIKRWEDRRKKFEFALRR
jgi:hypothetical protein